MGVYSERRQLLCYLIRLLLPAEVVYLGVGVGSLQVGGLDREGSLADGLRLEADRC